MVVAILAFYDEIKLIVIMTVLFAVFHFIGVIYIPQLIFGSSTYSFTMMLYHALSCFISYFNCGCYNNAIIELENTKDTYSISQELLISTEKTKTISSDIINKVEDVNRGAKKQLTDVEQTRRLMMDISFGIEQLANNSTKISNDAIDMSAEAKKGFDQIEKTIAQINQIY